MYVNLNHVTAATLINRLNHYTVTRRINPAFSKMSVVIKFSKFYVKSCGYVYFAHLPSTRIRTRVLSLVFGTSYGV